ncbi:MAG: KpsF/GutQ family sugar-phosphate isomerase [Acidobacteria bacterium]|nr:KpsF/GutQ family sugar-phosphate isomerase [Acidobacteriota bacterium]
MTPTAYLVLYHRRLAPEENQCSWLAAGRQAMQAEAEAIMLAASRLGENLCQAVQVILAHPGKVVVSGVGKSGQVGQKLAATLSSTGIPSVFLHAADAVHGDLGILAPGDPAILISKSGSTAELTRLLPALRELEAPLVGIIGNPNSRLAREVDIFLDASVDREASPAHPVPTASTTVAMALGDALAVALMQARNFTADDFGRNHPGGQLGRNLLLPVRAAMHCGHEVAWAGRDDSLKSVVIAMTRHPLGAACVVDPDGCLAGIVTDGDLRRALEAHDDIRGLRAGDVMTARPATISPEARLQDALESMENRPRQISVLPVVETKTGRCLGLLRLHDIYQGHGSSPR